MNDLQNKIYQLLTEMDNDESENGENVEKSKKPKSKGKDTPRGLDKGQLAKPAKEKFLTLSSKPITLGKRSADTPQEIEEKPEIEHLLNIVEKESTKDKE